MKVIEQKTLGELSIYSGKMLVTDPCYIPGSLGGKGTHVIDVPDTPGSVDIVIVDEGSWGKRVAELSINFRKPHGSYRGRETQTEIGEAYVDSGQMCFIDWDLVMDFNDDNQTGDVWEPEAHVGEFSYQGVCNLTLGMDGGILPNKIAASSTGFGDGAYPVYVMKDLDGYVTAVRVVFIQDEDELDGSEW